MTHAELNVKAHAFFSAHHAEHLRHDEVPHLVGRCVDHLIETTMVSKRTAETVTLQAYGERASRGCGAHVDMSNTTSYVVFICDPQSGRRHAFTAAELCEMSTLKQGGERDAIAIGASKPAEFVTL